MSSQFLFKNEVKTTLQTKIEKKLLKIIKYYSRTSLENFISTTVEVKMTKERRIPIYGFWLSFVMLSTEHMNIILKTHFDSLSLIPFIKKMMAIDQDSGIHHVMIESFINEYSNLFGTKVKNTLYDFGVPIGMSLPVLTRGFDNYLLEEIIEDDSPSYKIATKEKVLLNYIWEFEFRHRNIYCSAEIEMLSSRAYESLKSILTWSPEEHLLKQDPLI